jgi:tetratricopeptide (TPR) repeat protein
MPVYPHIKDRSRAQESVVKACFELKQSQRALGYIEKIDNWRRGAGYADLALYFAQHGAMKEKVEPYLNKAAKVADENEDWRRDRIRVKIAQAHILLGQHQQAQVFAAGVVNSEAGKVARTEAKILNADSFDREIEALEKTIISGQFDIVNNTLGAYAELFNRFYADVERRALIEEKIKAAWGTMPIPIRIDLLTELVGFALVHSDKVKALELVEEAESIVESVSWQPRFAIPIKAKLAELRFRAGDIQRARNQLQNALSLFDTTKEKIVDIYRAQMIRSIAEAYWVMGDPDVALDCYKRALEAGIENPNSRPRAEDLVATCCSMALHDVEPNAILFSRILKILDNLGDPW